MKFKENATIDVFCETIKQTYIGNNYLHQIKVEFYDGFKPVEMVFRTPEGFEQDQMQRIGTIDLKSD